MSKKLIIMIAGTALLSFAGAFVFAWLAKPSPQAQNVELEQSALSGEEGAIDTRQQHNPETGGTSASDVTIKGVMTEKQLKNLVYEVREKIHEYNYKLRDIEVQEHRLKMTQEMFKKDMEELNNLQIELAATVARLKNEQDKLFKDRITIAETEKDNLMAISATYDRMDVASAGKILTNIFQAQNNSSSDAIKILYYMSDRPRAKILASIAETEPGISAYFCQELKQIIKKD